MLTVRTNGMSTLACNQLTRANNCIKTSLERLSTGYRINSAKDDAANLAISKNMDCQISGNYVAQDNVQQGMNLLDIADGALDVMTQNVQRIRDLCVQAMNGTYSNEERKMMQSEVEQLTKEIYREKNTTSYNQIKLFESGVEETYEIAIANKGSSPTEEEESIPATTTVAETSAVSEWHGIPSEYQEVEYITGTGASWIDTGIIPTYNTKFDAIFQYTNIKNGNVLVQVDSGATGSRGYGITPWDGHGVYAFGNYTLTGTPDTNKHNYVIDKGKFYIDDKLVCNKSGSNPNCQYNLELLGWNRAGKTIKGSEGTLYSCQIYEKDVLIGDYIPCYRKSDGVTGVYDQVSKTFLKNSGSVEFITGPEVPDPTPPVPPPTPTEETVVDLQVGANSGEDNRLSVKTGFSLNSYSADVTTVDKASETLDKTDTLINTINTKRSELGAYKNRLESVLSSQETTVENLSASNSMIKDTDFASETAMLIKNQILQNMTASLVVQANTAPILALKLLQ